MAREERGVASRVEAAVAFAGPELPANTGALLPGQHVRLGKRQGAIIGILGLVALVVGIVAPGLLMVAAYWSFFFVFLTSAAIRLAALLTPRRPMNAPPLSDAALPRYTLIVPLYREAEVAHELVANLDRLDYPRNRLQALIVLEADDLATRSAFRALDLPSFIQVLVVPPGEPRTKPRACNVALTLAKGDLLVIYDAEDAPDPMQLREAAARFAVENEQLACLQAPLRIETPPSPAFIPQQFRLEYAALFDVLIPAYARWGMPFPLGGTSNHFRGIM